MYQTRVLCQTVPYEEKVTLIEDKPGQLAETLQITDRFNAEAAQCHNDSRSANLLDDRALVQAGAAGPALQKICRTADQLALRSQKHYLTAIRCFSLLGACLVLAFLLYDEMESDLFLVVYGLLILIYALTYAAVTKQGNHKRYLQYRMLAETARAQFYLTAAGIDYNVAGAFTWTQQEQAVWVIKAIRALLLADPGQPGRVDTDIIRKAWIDGQQAYHLKAANRSHKEFGLSERASRIMLFSSIVLFAAVVLLEFGFSQAMIRPVFSFVLPAVFLPHAGQVFTWRSLLKILLGSISAATFFVGNYYGRLSLQRKNEDHEKMARLYARAARLLDDKQMPADQLFISLARQEIIENGNWYSYCSENPPSFNL